MEYILTVQEKRRHANLLIQLWRFAMLSVRFMRLTRLGCARPR